MTNTKFQMSKYLGDFYRKKLYTLQTFTLVELLENENLLLFMTEGIQNASRIIEALMTAKMKRHDEFLASEISDALSHEDKEFFPKLINASKDLPSENYTVAWDAAVNRFTAEFIKDFCFADGTIDWEKLVRFVSAKKPKQNK